MEKKRWLKHTSTDTVTVTGMQWYHYLLSEHQEGDTSDTSWRELEGS